MLITRSEGPLLVMTRDAPLLNDVFSVYVKLDGTQQYGRFVGRGNAIGLSRR